MNSPFIVKSAAAILRNFASSETPNEEREKTKAYDKNPVQCPAAVRAAVVLHDSGKREVIGKCLSGQRALHVCQRADGRRRDRAAVENRDLSGISERIYGIRRGSRRNLPAQRAGQPTRSTSLRNISGNTSRERCTWSGRWCCPTRRRSTRRTGSATSSDYEPRGKTN